MGFVDPGKSNRSLAIGKRRRRSPTSTPPALKKQRSRPSSAPTPPPLSHFESLPAELLYRIFEHSYNLSLPRASLHLTHTLSKRHLQLNHVYSCRNSPKDLSRAFTLRFFTMPFLALLEERFGRLDATGCVLPARLLCAPWDDGQMGLLEALVERGAGLDEEEGDVHVASLHAALVSGRGDVVRMVVEMGVRPDTESVRLAMRKGDLEACRVLVGAGADVRNVEVWREALGLKGEVREEAVEWLLERAAPPGEVLGALSCR